MRVLIISDNLFLIKSFREVLNELFKFFDKKVFFEFRYSYFNKDLESLSVLENIQPIRIKNELEYLYNNIDLVISLHCKQLFPKELVKKVRCINIHPGLNPFNRGWFPQVFSIINKKPIGATIHIIDEKLDHGPVIVQKAVKLSSYDTSLTLYNKVLKAEIELIKENLLIWFSKESTSSNFN